MQPAPMLPCERVVPALAALERAAGDERSAERLAPVRAHLRTCAGCRRQHGARVSRLEGLCALRARRLPSGLLDDLGTRVLAQAKSGLSTGMSRSFLDAPQSLVRWRRAALAAGVLLAAGAGLLASGRLSWREPGVGGPGTGSLDLRDVLLPRWEAQQPSSRPTKGVNTVALPGAPGDAPAQGVDSYWMGPGGRRGDVQRPAARPRNAPKSD